MNGCLFSEKATIQIRGDFLSNLFIDFTVMMDSRIFVRKRLEYKFYS